jgi:GNAT superfamily N-acetyltransferase
MASINPTFAECQDRGDPGVRFARVTAQDRRRVLGLLLTGQLSETNAAIRQFTHFAESQGLSLDELWAATQAGRPLAAALILPSAGRTAMLFTSPMVQAAAVGIYTRLIATACGGQDPQSLRLIQCMLEPRQTLEHEALEQAGFSELATLIYMQRRIDAWPEDASFNDWSFQLLHWTEANRALFADAILASYEQTLDCPGLLSLRAIDDVIAGHMATGYFDPRLWYAVYEAHPAEAAAAATGEPWRSGLGEPVGVMLLSELPQGGAFELVYLGLSVKYRGRGLGKRLLRHGMAAAAARGGTSMLLAVDERNDPAVRLYRGLGFRSTGRKTAMIFTLK